MRFADDDAYEEQEDSEAEMRFDEGEEGEGTYDPNYVDNDTVEREEEEEEAGEEAAEEGGEEEEAEGEAEAGEEEEEAAEEAAEEAGEEEEAEGEAEAEGETGDMVVDDDGEGDDENVETIMKTGTEFTGDLYYPAAPGKTDQFLTIPPMKDAGDNECCHMHFFEEGVMVVDTVEELQALQTTKDAEKNEAWIKIQRQVLPHNMGVVRGRLKKEEKPLYYKKCLRFAVKKPGEEDKILESDDAQIMVLAPKMIINRVEEIINDFPREYGNSQMKEYSVHANNTKFFTTTVCKFAKTSKKKDGSEIVTLLREPTQTTNNGESSNAPEKRPAGAPSKKVAQTKAAPAAAPAEAPAEAPAAAKAPTKGIRALFAPKNQPESAPAGSKENAPAAAKPAPKKAPVAAKPTGKAAPAAAKPAAAKPAAAKPAPAAAKPTGKAAPAAAKAPEKPTPAAAKATTKATPAAPKHKDAAAPAAAAAEKRDREPSAPGDNAENPPKRPAANAKQAAAAPTVHMHSAAEFTFKNYDEMEKALFPSLSQNFESVKQGGFRVKVVTLAVPR